MIICPKHMRIHIKTHGHYLFYVHDAMVDYSSYKLII